MFTPHKSFAQDSKDRIVMGINQDLTGLSVRIRTVNQSTGTEVEATADIADPPASGVCSRAWQSNERPLAGGMFTVEAIVSWPGSPVEELTFPLKDPLVVEVRPRRTQVGANT